MTLQEKGDVYTKKNQHILEPISKLDKEGNPVYDSKGNEVKLSVSKILKKNHKISEDIVRVSFKPNSKKSKNKKKKGEDSFYNSLKMEFKEGDSNISAKIFPNGEIHITGSRNIQNANIVPLRIYDFVKQFMKNNKEIKLKDVRLAMLNTNFEFSTNISQEILKDKINQEYSVLNGGDWRKAVFQPSIYAGVNAQHWLPETKEKWLDVLKTGNHGYKLANPRKIGKIEKKKMVPKKVNGQTAVLIFRSGKAIITGAKTTKQLKMAYDSIVNIVRKYKDTIMYEDDSSDSDSDSDSENDSGDSSDYQVENRLEILRRNLHQYL